MVNTLQGQHLPFQMTFRKVISPISSKMGFNFCVRASDQQDVGEEKRPQESWRLTITEMQFHSSDRNSRTSPPIWIGRWWTNTEKNQRMRTVKKKTPNNTPQQFEIQEKTHAISVLFFFTDRLRGTTGTTNKRGKVAARKSTLRCRNGVTFRPPSPITKHSTETTPKRTIFFFDTWSVYTPDFTSQRITFYTARAEITRVTEDFHTRDILHPRPFFKHQTSGWDWSKKLKNNTKLKNIRWSLKEPQDTEGHLFCAKLIDNTFLAGTCLRGFCLQISGATFKSRHFADQTGHWFHCKDSAIHPEEIQIAALVLRILRWPGQVGERVWGFPNHPEATIFQCSAQRGAPKVSVPNWSPKRWRFWRTMCSLRQRRSFCKHKHFLEQDKIFRETIETLWQENCDSCCMLWCRPQKNYKIHVGTMDVDFSPVASICCRPPLAKQTGWTLSTTSCMIGMLGW